MKTIKPDNSFQQAEKVVV